jgi:hypothetical protein
MFLMPLHHFSNCGNICMCVYICKCESVAVVQAYNLSYLGDRESDHHNSRPAEAESSGNPISTNGWVQWLVCLASPSYLGKYK